MLAFSLLYAGMISANGLGMELVEGNVWEGNKDEVRAGCCCGPKVSNTNWGVKPCQVYLGCFQRFWLYECPRGIALDAQCWKSDGHGGVRHFDSSDNIILFSIMSRNTKWEDRCIYHSTREENTDHFEESLLCSY